ncbi:unnamed protein product [Durusdinium trenchii]|uniref:Uncharacterized protein n=1 Tax=Durusdinium trenchii TaxID=1381693 RepID=A0ABP0QL84_9DINO
MQGLLVGDAVDTICVLEMEVLAQDQAARVRVAAAEDKAAAAKIQLDSMARAIAQERKQALANLQRYERDVELEVSRKIRQAESHAQAEDVKFACEILEKILKMVLATLGLLLPLCLAKGVEELKLQSAYRALSSAKFDLDCLQRKVAAHAQHAETLANEAERRVQEVVDLGSSCVDFARAEGQRLAATKRILALPGLSSQCPKHGEY